jgi:hypothetical protein
VIDRRKETRLGCLGDCTGSSEDPRDEGRWGGSDRVVHLATKRKGEGFVFPFCEPTRILSLLQDENSLEYGNPIVSGPGSLGRFDSYWLEGSSSYGRVLVELSGRRERYGDVLLRDIVPDAAADIEGV